MKIDDEDYVTITTDVIWNNPDSLTIRPPKPHKINAVQHIGKSLIHGADLIRVDKATKGTGPASEQTFRVMRWKARRLGWE